MSDETQVNPRHLALEMIETILQLPQIVELDLGQIDFGLLPDSVNAFVTRTELGTEIRFGERLLSKLYQLAYVMGGVWDAKWVSFQHNASARLIVMKDDPVAIELLQSLDVRSNDAQIVFNGMARASIGYVLAHEVGHLALGHLDDHLAPQEGLVWAHSWSAETEADAFAVDCLNELFGPPLIAAGVTIVLELAKRHERAATPPDRRSIDDIQNYSSIMSHPQPGPRRTHLVEILLGPITDYNASPMLFQMANDLMDKVRFNSFVDIAAAERAQGLALAGLEHESAFTSILNDQRIVLPISPSVGVLAPNSERLHEFIAADFGRAKWALAYLTMTCVDRPFDDTTRLTLAQVWVFFTNTFQDAAHNDEISVIIRRTVRDFELLLADILRASTHAAAEGPPRDAVNPVQ